MKVEKAIPFFDDYCFYFDAGTKTTRLIQDKWSKEMAVVEAKSELLRNKQLLHRLCIVEYLWCNSRNTKFHLI